MFPLYDLNPHRRFPWVTVLVILLNVVVMVFEGIEPDTQTVYRYGFIPKRVTELKTGKPIVVQPVRLNRAGQEVKERPIQLSSAPTEVYLTFLTAMFLHGSWLHLGSNMWMLWIFGNNVEDRLGAFMYFCYYLVGGFMGTFCQWMVDPSSTVPMIGASGAVATVLGGYAITYPKAMVKTLIFVGLPLFVNLPALLVLGIWFLVQMAAGLNIFRELLGGEQVAFWAHIGGFVAGVVLMPILSLGASPADADWKREVQELFNFDDPRVPKS
jgi:membrane associated rhomboid family serine protease